MYSLIGLEGSFNYGEEPLGLLLQAAFQNTLIDTRIFGSTSNKIESRAGYILGLDLDLHKRIGPLVGIGYRYRDGGLWTKQSLWLRGGLALGPLVLVGAIDTITSNRVRLGELRLRLISGRLVVEPRLGIASYDRGQLGGHASISMGLAF